jgi:hypothetical protein
MLRALEKGARWSSIRQFGDNEVVEWRLGATIFVTLLLVFFCAYLLPFPRGDFMTLPLPL